MRSWLKVLNEFWRKRGLILSERWLSARAQTQIMGLACLLLVSSSNSLFAAVRVQPIPALRTSTPGFELVPETDSGIRFVNSVPDSQIMANHNVMLGSGVAAGDVDGDGLTDLFFCSLNGSNALYRNLGAWRFEPVPEAGGAAYPGTLKTSALLSDADGDGDLDLFLGSLGHGVRLLLNNGQGRFSDVTSSSGLASKAGTMSLAAGDVDLDGDLDLYVVNYGAQAVLRTGSGSATVKKIDGNWVVQGPHADRLRYVDGRLEEVGEPDVLFLCVGPGKYRAVPWGGPEFVDADGKPQVMPWDFGLAAQIRDINQDGNPDIYVCNDFQTPDRIWLGDGKGRFRALPWLAMRCQSFASMGVDFADVDRDGHLDFYVVEMLPSEHSRRLRQTASRPPFALTPGFFENRPEVTRSTFFRARGDGTFAEMAQFSGLDATDWSWQPVFLDVDLDGWEDILVVNGYPRDTQDRDALAAIQAAGRGTPGQSRSNFLRYPVMKNRNLAFRNLGDLKFKEQGREWGFDSDRISQGALLADLDQDGDADVVISCLNPGPVLLRNQTASPRISVRLKQPGPNPRGIGARIRVIGKKLIQEQEVISGGRYLSSAGTIQLSWG
ncbi:MAG: VCBS repeat-containing protein [Verrucomicrobia bacterium]|nr:VCBS repeat-containing protein [Verrucomicrobiota bacterium]